MQIPSFDPICSFNQVKSHTSEQVDITPEEDDEVAPQMVQQPKTEKLAKVKKVKNEKKENKTVRILSPVQEEDQSDYTIEKDLYKAIFKKVH